MAVETLQQVIAQIRQSKNILILPSSPPDGDCIGAALAMYLVLRKLGKEPSVAISEDIPDNYKFLPETNEIHHELTGIKDFIIQLDCKDASVDTIKYQVEDDVVNIIITPKKGHFKKDTVSFQNGTDKYDLIIIVDAGDIHQLRDIYDDNREMFNNIPTINIDHHSSNSMFGTLNYVDLNCSSTTQCLLPIIDGLNNTGGEIIDKDIATLLLTGLITDTGSFQHANTTPKAFEDASRLLDLGAQQQQIIKKVYKTKSLSTLKLWGRVLSKIEFDKQNRIVWSTITTQDLIDTNSTTEESNGIIDELMSNAPGAELILLIKQKKDDLVSVSVRTNSNDVDGSAFAAKFGGGGHVRAAGFRVKGKSLEDAKNEIIHAAKIFQSERLENSKSVVNTPDETTVKQLTKDFFNKDNSNIQTAAAIQPEPIASVQPAPIAPIQPEPIAPVQPAPIAPVQPAPIAPIQPEPIAPVQPAQLHSNELARQVAKMVSQSSPPVPPKNIDIADQIIPPIQPNQTN